MKITDVRIKLPFSYEARSVLGYASITFDGVFVVHECRIIDGHKLPFVSMPNHKRFDRCSGCGRKNVFDAVFCNWCGIKQGVKAERTGADGVPTPLYYDVAHPIDSAFRSEVEQTVIQAWEWESKAAEVGTDEEDNMDKVSDK